MRLCKLAPSPLLLLLLLLLLRATAATGTGGGFGESPYQDEIHVRVTNATGDWRNPHVTIETGRPETSYDGPLMQFTKSHMINGGSLRMQIEGGGVQCFYFVLTKGYVMHMHSAISSDSDHDVFNVYITSSNSEVFKNFMYKSVVTYELNATHTDTYEICLHNPHGPKTVTFSCMYWLPEHHQDAMKDLVGAQNVSTSVMNSLQGIELAVNLALSEIRYKPFAHKDYQVLEACHSRVLQRSLFTICLVLLSAGGTTLFIRRLFNEPNRGSRSGI